VNKGRVSVAFARDWLGEEGLRGFMEVVLPPGCVVVDDIQVTAVIILNGRSPEPARRLQNLLVKTRGRAVVVVVGIPGNDDGKQRHLVDQGAAWVEDEPTAERMAFVIGAAQESNALRWGLEMPH